MELLGGAGSETLTQAAIRVNLEAIMLSDISQKGQIRYDSAHVRYLRLVGFI